VAKQDPHHAESTHSSLAGDIGCSSTTPARGISLRDDESEGLRETATVSPLRAYPVIAKRCGLGERSYTGSSNFRSARRSLLLWRGFLEPAETSLYTSGGGIRLSPEASKLSLRTVMVVVRIIAFESLGSYSSCERPRVPWLPVLVNRASNRPSRSLLIVRRLCTAWYR
jgi:hypothetical protein